MGDSNTGREKRFCSYCGTKLDVGASFCKECGKAVDGASSTQPPFENQDTKSDERRSGNPTERKTVYEGYIHKCPHCGEVLKSFVANCPSCGYEIRDTKSSTSIREFAAKLERIEARQMPAFEEKKSVMKMVFGRDLKNEDEAENARNEFEEQKEREKINVIKNFSVPNTKEDIIEFMILVSSNIDVKKGVDDDVSKAWISKLEQVYQRAQLTMGKNRDFAVIKNIYDRKKAELKNRKFKGLAIASFIVGGYILLMSFISFMAETPAASIILLLVGIALLAGGVKFISIYNRNNKNLL